MDNVVIITYIAYFSQSSLCRLQKVKVVEVEEESGFESEGLVLG